MKDLISEFNAYLLNVKKSSSNTVESYIRDINRYSEYLKTSDRDFLNADTAVLRGYLDYLTMLGKSESTKTRIIASIRCFYKFFSIPLQSFMAGCSKRSGG